MNIFDVGAGEIGFLVLLALIFIGPKRMSETSKDIGRWLNKFVRSDTWAALKEVSNAIVHAPNRMMREANLEDLQRELDLNAGMVVDNDPSSVSFVTDQRAGEAVADRAILPPGRSVSFAPHPPSRVDEAVTEEKKPPAKRSAPAAKKKPSAGKSPQKTSSRAKTGGKKQSHV